MGHGEEQQMRGWNARRWFGVGLAAAIAIGTTALTIPVSAAADDATIYLVQGLPGKTVSFTIDGKTVLTNQKSGADLPAARRWPAASGGSR